MTTLRERAEEQEALGNYAEAAHLYSIAAEFMSGESADLMHRAQVCQALERSRRLREDQ